jgi:hypothetical protein
VEEAAELLSKIQTVNNLMLLTQDVSIAHLDSSQVLMESASRSILSARQQIQMEVVLLVTLDTRLQVIFVSLALKLTLMSIVLTSPMEFVLFVPEVSTLVLKANVSNSIPFAGPTTTLQEPVSVAILVILFSSTNVLLELVAQEMVTLTVMELICLVDVMVASRATDCLLKIHASVLTLSAEHTLLTKMLVLLAMMAMTYSVVNV